MGKRTSLFIVLLVAIFFRFFYLTKSPPALNWDEVSIGYNAYSILKTGRDEWGKLMPLAFPAFGETKLPAMVYTSIPAIAVFGLTDFAVRFTPALIGVLAVYVMYLLAKELLGDKYALPSALLLAISPWHVHLSRGSFEAGLALLALMLSLLYFYRGLKSPKSFLLSAAFAALAMYSYNSARIVIPILFPTLILLNLRTLKPTFQPLFMAFLLGLILMLPAVLLLSGGSAFVRFKTLNFGSSKGFTEGIGESRRYTPFPSPIPQLIHNKYTHYVHQFFLNYISSFGSEFLLFKGDKYTQRSTQGMGLLYFFELPILIFGLYQMGSHKSFGKFILPWLLIAPIPSAVTIDAPSALRGLNALPPILLIESIGLVALLPYFAKRKAWTIALSLFVIWNIGYFIYRELGAYPVKYSSDWGYGYKQAVSSIQKSYSSTDKVYMTTMLGEPYIYTLFYMQYDPHKFQTDPNLHKSTDNVGWTHVDSFDKFVFTDLNSEFYKPSEIIKREKGNLMFIAGLTQLGGVAHDEVIMAPNWEVMFEIGRAKGAAK